MIILSPISVLPERKYLSNLQQSATPDQLHQLSSDPKMRRALASSALICRLRTLPFLISVSPSSLTVRLKKGLDPFLFSRDVAACPAELLQRFVSVFGVNPRLHKCPVPGLQAVSPQGPASPSLHPALHKPRALSQLVTLETGRRRRHGGSATAGELDEESNV